MSTAGVSACLIVKDGVTTLPATVESLRPHVAEICVYDTGSSDGTVELLAELAAQPGAPLVVECGEWRDDFGWARERSFALASQPWRMYLDDDDLLVGGERLAALLLAAENAGAHAISVAYDHHDAPDGGASWLWTNRILHRDSGRWEGVVHELWRGLRIEEIALAHPAALRVRHTRRVERPGRYRSLVERAAADPARTPRGLMMLGFELLRLDDVQAVAALEGYLKGRYDAVEGDPNGYRWIVLDQLVQAYGRLGRLPQAAACAAARDAYTREISRAIALGTIEDVEFWRRLLARMDELVPAEPVDLLLPGPGSALHRPRGADGGG